MIRSFVTHAHVTSKLLIATLVPIVKDKLADLCSSKNYRSIAISSLILKLLDWNDLAELWTSAEEQRFSIWVPTAEQHFLVFVDGL